MRMELVFDVAVILLAGVGICGSLVYAFGRSSRGRPLHGTSKS